MGVGFAINYKTKLLIYLCEYFIRMPLYMINYGKASSNPVCTCAHCSAPDEFFCGQSFAGMQQRLMSLVGRQVA